MRLFLMLTWMIILSPSFAKTNPCDGTRAHPCHVWDAQGNPKEVKHWRMLKMIARDYKGNHAGVENMNISASGAPSEAGWQTIKRAIDHEAPQVKHIFVLDLRQESHGYVNKDPVTLVAEYNWVNLNKSPNQSQYDELSWLINTISPLYLVTNQQYKEKRFADGKYTVVNTLRSEKQVVEDNGMIYVRFTVTDHMAPRDDEVDRFIQFAKNITQHDWLHIHCRGGEGRTVTFFTMYDMLHNADKVSFDDIIKRQASIVPYYDLSQFDRPTSELKVYFIMRYEFLKEFYAYAKGRLQGDKRTWTEYHSKLS